MSESQHLSASLTRLYFGSKVGVFASFETATNNLTSSQAAHIPAEKFNSVWAITNHVWYWQEALRLLLIGETYTHTALGAPDDSGWIPVTNPNDESAWQFTRERALNVNKELSAVIEKYSNAELEEIIPAWGGERHRVIQSIIAHNSYHTAEIICVRHMQGLWLEST